MSVLRQSGVKKSRKLATVVVGHICFGSTDAKW